MKRKTNKVNTLKITNYCYANFWFNLSDNSIPKKLQKDQQISPSLSFARAISAPCCSVHLIYFLFISKMIIEFKKRNERRMKESLNVADNRVSDFFFLSFENWSIGRSSLVADKLAWVIYRFPLHLKWAISVKFIVRIQICSHSSYLFAVPSGPNANNIIISDNEQRSGEALPFNRLFNKRKRFNGSSIIHCIVLHL